MYIPANTPENNVGKFATTNRDVVVIKGTLTKGSRVKIIDISSRGYDIQDCESGEKFIECGFDLFEEF